MKTKRSVISCRSFLTQANCNISYRPLRVESWSVLLLIVVYAVGASFHFAQTATILWQSLLSFFAIALLIYKTSKRLFYCEQSVHLVCAIPQQKVYWREREYQLCHSSRYGFLGFWLVLKPVLADASSNQRLSQQLFIPRFLLSENEISLLSILIFIGQNEQQASSPF